MKRGIQIPTSPHLLFFLKNEIPLVDLGDAVRYVSLCALLGLCVNLISHLQIIVRLPCISSLVLHPLPVPRPHEPDADREPELWVYTVGLSSWGCTSGRATHPDKIYNLLGSSLKRTWSHIIICKQDLQVKGERDSCDPLCPTTKAADAHIHPKPETWPVFWCQSFVPAHDATCCARISVAWPYTSGKKGVQRLHSDLKFFETEIWFLSGN